MTKCPACGGSIVSSTTSTEAEPYHYVESGLDNVMLIGVAVRRCEACGDAPVIPDLPGLHSVIAGCLAKAPSLLTDREMMFLCGYAQNCSSDEKKLVARLNEVGDMLRAGIVPPTLRSTLETTLRQLTLRLVEADDQAGLLRRLAAIVDDEPEAKPARLTIRKPKGKPWRHAHVTAQVTAC